MTKRLYYLEPYRTTFEATVTTCDVVDGRPNVVLDQTAFYPTSGGQPFDTGTLGGARVMDVVDRADGAIAHVLDREVEPGARVHGSVDWSRRFDHMQQHTGQHVLSAALDRLFNLRTESFHLGVAASTIDLSREVSPSQVSAAEDEANRIVWEDRAVSIRFASAEEAAALPLRKESVRTGALRLIEIDDFDLSACGGTHVARTGAIGIIAITAWEKFRGGSRVEFLCGARVLTRFHTWRTALAATMKHLSVAPEDLAAGIDRLQSESRALQKRIRGLQEQLAVHEAAAFVGRGERVGDRVMIVSAVEGWDAAGLKALAAAAAAAEPRGVVALFSKSTPALVVIARGKEAAIDAGAVLGALVGMFGGKGGGKADLAQGGGLQASSADLIAAVRKLLV